MHIGMILPRINPLGAQLTSATFIEAARRLEAMDFDSAWLTDSIGRGYPTPDPLIALAAVATVTQRINVGTSVLQVSIRDPAMLARQVMTTHLIAGDRLSLGIGAGSTRADFEATGQSFENRFVRFEESLNTLRRLWNGESVGGTSLTPFDATKGGPKLLIGSWGSRSWIPRAAREFHGWMGSAHHGTWNVIERGIRVFREAGGKWAVIANIIVDPEAADVPDDRDTHLGPAGLGTTAERLRRFRDLGFDEAIMRTRDHTDAVVGRLADIVSMDDIRGSRP